MKRGLLALVLVAIVAAPAQADILQTISDVNVGQTPAALTQVTANGITLTRVLFTLIFGTAIVAAFVKTCAETRSLDNFGFALTHVFMWILGPLIVVNVVLGILPNIGAFFQGIAHFLGVQIVTPAALLAVGLSISVNLIDVGGKMGGGGLGVPFVFGPAAFTDAVAWVCAFVVVVCFVSIAAKLFIEIWGLFLSSAMGSWRVALLGSTVTEGQGWSFIFSLLGKGSTIVTLLVVAALITAEASSWPAYLEASTTSDFIRRGMTVDGGAIFCVLLTWGVAKECGLAFAANAAKRRIS